MPVTDRVPPRHARAAVALAVALLGGLLAGCASDGDRTVTVQLRDAAGLFEGNDVGVLGVPVGEVVSVTPRGARVDVVLRVEESAPVPADASAVVVSRSVATDRYVELTPRRATGPQLQDGAVIPLERTRTPVEFDELLATLTDVSGALAGPEGSEGPLARVLDASAETLDGNGVLLRDGLGDLADVLEDVEGGLGDVEGTVDGLGELSGALAEEDALVRRFGDEVAEATSMLAGQKEALTDTFRALAAMVAEVADFVRRHRDQLDGQLEDFTALAADLNAHREEYETLLDDAPLMLQNFTRAINDEGRMVFRTRPLDLVPGEDVVRQLCADAGDVCERLGLLELPIFELLQLLSGVRTE